jgi:hypothetical protein
MDVMEYHHKELEHHHKELEQEVKSIKSILGVGQLFHLLFVNIREKNEDERRNYLSKLGIKETEVALARSFYKNQRCPCAHPSIEEDHINTMTVNSKELRVLAKKLFYKYKWYVVWLVFVKCLKNTFFGKHWSILTATVLNGKF